MMRGHILSSVRNLPWYQALIPYSATRAAALAFRNASSLAQIIRDRYQTQTFTNPREDVGFERSIVITSRKKTSLLCDFGFARDRPEASLEACTAPPTGHTIAHS